MPARTGCCCFCPLEESTWAGSTIDFFFKHNVLGSSSVTLSQISDDGTTLGCKKYTYGGDLTTPVVSKASPCLQIASHIDFDLTPGPGSLYGAHYAFGQIFSSCVLIPNGHSWRMQYSLDTTMRYLKYVTNNGPFGTVTSVSLDASVPIPTDESGFYAEELQRASLAVKQGSAFYFFRSGSVDTTIFEVEGRGGYQYVRPTFDRIGEWLRQIQMGNHTNDIALDGPLKWFKWGNPTSVGDYPYIDACPDFSSGADPIYFGWVSFSGASQQYIPLSPGGINYDLRFVTTDKTIRIDRLCITLTDAGTGAASCTTGCYGTCHYDSVLGTADAEVDFGVGTYSWSAPSGGLLQVIAQGGGGAGGTGQPGASNGGQGGGGGGLSSIAVSVAAGDTIYISNSANGSPGDSSGQTSGGDGGDAAVTGIVTITGHGGKGGQGQGGTTKTGAGGTATGGDTNLTGGSATSPTSATGTHGGTSPDGAPGGTGSHSGANGGSGVDGSLYGGGGGGSGQAAADLPTVYGGAGGDPVVRVTFIPYVWAPASPTDNCSGSCSSPCPTVNDAFYTLYGHPVHGGLLEVNCS